MQHITNKLHTPYGKTRQKIQGPYTRIYLVRHCKPDYSVKEEVGDENMPLSELGKKQRVLLNRKLNQVKPEVIYSSEFLRSHQTAEVYAKQKNLKIIVDSRLNEIDWEEWYKIKYFNMSRKTRVRRMEKYRSLNRRLQRLHTKSRRLIADIYKQHKGKNIGIFCHGNVIRAMLTSILNADVIGFLSMEIYQSSVTKLVIDKNGYIKINYINNIGHLPHRPDEDLFLAALNQ